MSAPQTGLFDGVVLPDGQVVARADLARALIANGQLTLGPEAFQSPDAMRALAMGLQQAAWMGASPTGGNMSSPAAWFGLGGTSPGGTTPLLPFGNPFQAGGTGNVMIPADAAGGGSILGSLVGALPGLLTGLANAGIIRGSVGNFLAPQQQNPLQALGVPGLQLTAGQVMAAAGAGMGIAEMGMDALSALFGSGQSCGRSRPPVQAPSLFRMSACGGMSLPARQQVIGPDGSLYVIASLGKATRGSREEATMRRLARQNGFTVARKGTGGGRSRRRRPR